MKLAFLAIALLLAGCSTTQPNRPLRELVAVSHMKTLPADLSPADRETVEQMRKTRKP